MLMKLCVVWCSIGSFIMMCCLMNWCGWCESMGVLCCGRVI